MLKVTLMFAFLGSSVLADGQMGGGGREGCTVNCPPPPCTENCGRTEQAVDAKDMSDPVAEVVIVMIRRYFSRF
jgi:hypothetical protein